MKYDAFICHASEDKDSFARPLASLLRALGLNIWYDEFTVKPGVSLREAIDRGISQSKYGIVILSPAFFRKPWTAYELDGLTGIDLTKRRPVVLPVWHKVSHKDVAKFSPSLAMKVAIHSEYGVDEVARKILEVISPPSKWRKPKPESGIYRLGFAGAGSQVFMSRTLKMISIWRGGENTDLLDAYNNHPLYKKNPHLGVVLSDAPEEFTRVVDLPEDTSWYLVFYRMDFPPLEGNPFTPDILSRVDSGEYYALPIPDGGAQLFQVQGMPNPTMTVLFSLPNQDGTLSVVVGIGPG